MINKDHDINSVMIFFYVQDERTVFCGTMDGKERV